MSDAYDALIFDFQISPQGLDALQAESMLNAPSREPIRAEFILLTNSPREPVLFESLMTDGDVRNSITAEFLIARKIPTPAPRTVGAETDIVLLDGIEHAIYCNPDIIPIRGQYEVDLHTHVKIPYEVELASHIPALNPGNILKVNSTRRGKAPLCQVTKITISGKTEDSGNASLTATLTANEYKEFHR